MTMEIKNNELIIRLPISKRSSKSGKTTIIASTNGNVKTDQIVDGQCVTVGVNAYIPKS